MAVYRTIGTNIKDIIDFIVQNDELKLLLKYTGSNALEESANNVSIKDLMENNIYPYANIAEPEDNVKSFISIYLWDGKKAGVNNIYHRNARIYVDILCHESIWTLDDGLFRPYLILDDLDTQIPEIRTESTRGTLSYVDTVYIRYNTKFCGYRLIYEVTNPSKRC